MVVNVGQIERGIATYIDKEIMPKLPENSVERVVLGFASARIIKRYSSKLIALKDTETDKLIGIFDKDGNVDIDSMRSDFKAQFPDDGITKEVPVIGLMRFKKEDIDKLYEYIVEQIGAIYG